MGNVIRMLSRTFNRVVYVQLRVNQVLVKVSGSADEVKVAARAPFSGARMLVADPDAARATISRALHEAMPPGLAPVLGSCLSERCSDSAANRAPCLGRRSLFSQRTRLSAPSETGGRPVGGCRSIAGSVTQRSNGGPSRVRLCSGQATMRWQWARARKCTCHRAV